MTPRDAVTNNTLTFLSGILSPRARVLEVGCREGLLAHKLQTVGYDVVAIDSNPRCVSLAKHLGLDARWAEWPDFEECPFDAILFTRSLHHMRSLDEAVKRCASLMRREAVVFCDEFSADIGPHSAEWLYHILNVLRESSLINPDRTQLPSLLAENNALDGWRIDHRGVHEIASITDTLAKYFACVDCQEAPYLYRYIADALTEDMVGYRLAQAVQSLEVRIARFASEPLLGRRIVCSGPRV